MYVFPVLLLLAVIAVIVVLIVRSVRRRRMARVTLTGADGAGIHTDGGISEALPNAGGPDRSGTDKS